MEHYHVIVQQDDNKVHFAFNDFSDAMKFATTCMEAVDKGTEVIYYEDKEG